MDDRALLALLAAAVLAAVHIFGGKLRFLSPAPRSAWLSGFGGVSVAYVFVHLLPELAEGQEAVERRSEGEGPLLGFLEHHVYLVALAGLALFYAIEQHSLRSRRRERDAGRGDRTDDGVLEDGAVWRNTSIVGTSFDARVLGRVPDGLLTEVTGTAFRTGEHRFVLDPRDPLREGFVLR